MKKFVSLFMVMLMVAALVLTGCGKTDGAQGSSDSAGITEAREDVVRVINGDPNTFNPLLMATAQESTLNVHLYDSLLTVNADGSFAPNLCESYTISEDGLVYTLKIREGVKFHNGETMTANDVVFSITAAQQSPVYAATLSSIASVEAVDETTVQMTLLAPHAQILSYLGVLYVLNEKAVTEAGDAYNSNPVGTGPYKFVSYERAYEIKMTRFDEYWQGPARIKDVTFRIIADMNTATVSLQNGDVDMSNFSPASLATLEADKGIQLVDASTPSIYMAILNHEVAPFDNKLVRQAVAYALDKEYMIDVYGNGMGDLASTVLPKSMFGYSEAIEADYSYDVETAKALLADAGITTPMDVGVILVTESFKPMAEIVQANLSDIGLNAKVEIAEASAWSQAAAEGNFSITLTGLAFQLGAEADYVGAFLSAATIGSLNFARYNNPEVDKMLFQTRMMTDANARLQVYTDAFKIVGEEVALIPLYYPTMKLAANANLTLDADGYFLNTYDWQWNA